MIPELTVETARQLARAKFAGSFDDPAAWRGFVLQTLVDEYLEDKQLYLSDWCLYFCPCASPYSKGKLNDQTTTN
jgi:hypothetical protein